MSSRESYRIDLDRLTVIHTDEHGEDHDLNTGTPCSDLDGLAALIRALHAYGAFTVATRDALTREVWLAKPMMTLDEMIRAAEPDEGPCMAIESARALEAGRDLDVIRGISREAELRDALAPVRILVDELYETYPVEGVDDEAIVDAYTAMRRVVALLDRRGA